MTPVPTDKKASRKAVKTAYDLFAPYYDHYMKHVDYDHWTECILAYYENHASRPLKDVLELACGTANVSERLVKKGYNVTASDRSEEMIRQAGKKAHKPVLKTADMLSELPQASFDLVLLIFDSINYLLEKGQVITLFENVSKSLLEQGLFIFDISTVKNSRDYFDGYINIEEDDDHSLIHRADYDPQNRFQKTRLTIFRREGELYRRLYEEHSQKVYLVSELLTLAESSPLKCEGIYGVYHQQNLLKTNIRKLDLQYSRLFFVLRNIGGKLS